MDITLTWDLFAIMFFATVITYSFIIGKHESVKLVIATYIATVAVQGLGNILVRLNGENESLLLSVGITLDDDMLSLLKLLLFIVVIIFLVVRGGLDVDYNKESSSLINIGVTGVFGFATAGLLLSTLLSYIAGGPLLDNALAQTDTVSPIIAQSKVMQLMILNQDLWYALPALLLVGVRFISSEPLED